MPQFYDDACFEQIIASDLLTNYRRYICSVYQDRYTAARITGVMLDAPPYIAIDFDVRYGVVTATEDDGNGYTVIGSVLLDGALSRASVTRYVLPEAQLLVLKREHEPEEEE